MSNSNVGLCLSFYRAYAKLRLQLDEELGIFHGIDLDDFALLHSLTGVKEAAHSLKNLAAELGVSRSAMLRRLRPLEKIGLVACHYGVTERTIALCPAGRSLLHAAHDTVGGVCDKLFRIEEVDRLNDVLLKAELLRSQDTAMDQQR